MNLVRSVIVALLPALAGCAGGYQRLPDGLIDEIRRGPETMVVKGGVATVPVVGGKTLPLVEVRINERGPYRLLVDLGSNVCILRRDVASASGSALVVDRDTSDIFRADSTELGGMRMNDIVYGAYEELDVDGVLGFNALDERPFTLDYPGMALTVGGEALPGAGDDPLVFDYEVRRHMPFLPARLGDRTLALNFDTGARGWIVLPMSMKDELPLVDEPVPGYLTFNNQTGAARVRLARLEGVLEFGPARLPAPMVQFNPDVDEPFVGSSLLAHFRLTFDPANRRVRMEPVTDRPIHVPGFPTFGVKLERTPGGLFIADVIPGTPAFDAGLEPDTAVSLVNGAEAARLSDEAVGAVNRAAGMNRLELVMERSTGARGIQLDRVVLAGPGPGVEPSAVGELATVSRTSDRAGRIDRYLSAMEALGFSGAVIVSESGEVVLRKGYGLADRETRRPYTPTTVQTHGSITKQITAAAVLLLESRGELSVDESITKYFDDVPEDKRGITLHHLLTHSAGLPGSIGPDNEPIGAEDYVERAMAAPLQFEPGTGYGYSNVGFALLGIIVERVSGKGYERFLREELLLPAGLTETGYLLPDWNLDRLAVGYLEGERWGRVYERRWREDGPGWHLRANGGLHTTVDDMYRWLETVKGEGVLPEEAAGRWTTGYVDEGGGDSRYAYGWAVHDTGDGPMIAHNGGNGIFSADFVWLPGRDFFLYVQGNTSVIPAAQQREALLGAAFDESFDMPPRVKSANDAGPADATRRQGVYEFVRAEFDDGVQMWGVLWRADGTYRGTAIGPPSDVPSLVLVPNAENRYTGVRREPPWDVMEFRFENECLVASGMQACAAK